MNLVEAPLRHPGDNKKILRADLSCKWTPISLQGELSVSTILWIPNGSTFHVRIRVIENLVPVILFPKTIQKEDFPNFIVTLMMSKIQDKRGKSKNEVF